MAELQAKVVVNGLVHPLRSERHGNLRLRISSSIGSCVASDIDTSVLDECVNHLWRNYSFMGLCELKLALSNVDHLTLKTFKARMASYHASRRKVLRDLVKREVHLV
ncbi:MAG: hypothetical protein AAGG68_28770 [Bacteroidota bacterium]